MSSSNLEPGCLAIITESVTGAHVGVVVQCIQQVGEHSLYGTVWEVRSKTKLVTEHGGHGYVVHVPAKWLRKITPDAPTLTTTKDKELEV